jgi:hypothetical protein
MAHKFFVPE